MGEENKEVSKALVMGLITHIIIGILMIIKIKSVMFNSFGIFLIVFNVFLLWGLIATMNSNNNDRNKNAF